MLDRLRKAIEARIRGFVPQRLVVRGIPVVVENSRADIHSSDVIARLDEALGLIETHQPWRLAHLRRDIAAILVTRYPCRGAYIPAHRTVITELTFLARRDISAAPVASSIVHEGIHARVHRMGVHPASRTPAEEERLCRKAELAFGESLPAAIGRPVIERALQSLDLVDEDVAPSIDWNEAIRRQDDIDRNSRR
jgi:hypothetical protein